jgi:hypothetical protein
LAESLRDIDDFRQPAPEEDHELAVATDAASDDQVTLAEMVARVTQGLQHFAVAVKNCGLYPANSAIRQESVAKSHEWFRSFLEQQEALRLFVDPDQLLFQGQPVHKDKPGEPSLLLPMFRDGLQWLEFNDGLTSQEFGTFVELLNRYRLLKDEDENDLVTAMWAADFQFIKHKTANDFWDIDPVNEISSLQAGPGLASSLGLGAGDGGGGQAGVAALLELAEGGSPSRSIPNLPGREDLASGSEAHTDGSDERGEMAFHQTLRMAEEDRQALMELTAQEARGETLMGGLAPALDLLWRLRTVAQARSILAFLGESAKAALSSGLFADVLALMARVSLIAERAAPRLAGLWAEFEAGLASPEVLAGLALYRQPSAAEGAPAAGLDDLDVFLGRLPEQAVKSLALTAASAGDPAVASALLRAVAARSPAVTPELGGLINTVLKPPLLLELIERLRPSLEAGHGLELMTTLSRHMNQQVREAASLALLAANPSAIATLSHLLSEADPALNRRIYSCLGASRNAKVEKAILNFLRSSKQVGVNRDEEALLNAYRALGLSAATQAASEYCLEVANQKGARALLGLEGEQERAHRSGAMLALILMGQGEQVAGLGRSLFTDLRRAAQAAETEAAKVRRPIGQPGGPIGSAPPQAR